MASSIFLDLAPTGTFAGTVTFANPALFADGTATAPSVAFASSTGTGLWAPAANTLGVAASGVAQLRVVANNIIMRDAMAFGWSSTADPQSSSDVTLARDAANTLALKNSTNAQALRLYRTTTGPVYNEINLGLPTISSGFGTSPSIVAGSTAFCFRVNVGTGGVATSGVVGMPTAPTGWQAIAQDMTNNVASRVSATTVNSITLTAGVAWTASDIIVVYAVAF